MQVLVPATPLAIQLPADGLGNQQKGLGPLEQVLDSCLWINPALALMAIWGVNQRWEVLFFYSPSLSIIMTFK